jgi:hypothetical protein
VADFDLVSGWSDHFTYVVFIAYFDVARKPKQKRCLRANLPHQVAMASMNGKVLTKEMALIKVQTVAVKIHLVGI